MSWFLNGELIDDEFEHNSGNIIENRLLWPSIQRHDLYSVFTCRAVNTKTVAPREKRLVLDMYRKYKYNLRGLTMTLIEIFPPLFSSLFAVYNILHVHCHNVNAI